MRIVQILLVLLFISQNSRAEHLPFHVLCGKVCDGATSQPLPFAQVYIEDLSIGTLTDEQGWFRLDNLPQPTVRLQISCLGYAVEARVVDLPCDTLLCTLRAESLHLLEVEVMAEKEMDGSKMTVRQTALEHIQPSNLNDIFQLLPGYLSSDGDLSQVQQYAARQAGQDDNTALGLALMSDGVPVMNNGQSDMVNYVYATKDDRYSTVNKGVDLRSMSTHHVGKVEVVQGIASAKYGDLSSGVVNVTAKSGVSAYEILGRVNAQSKSVYVGKGVRLSDRSSLHAGLDVTKSQADVCSDLTAYTRVSGQLNYMRKSRLGVAELIHNWKLSYVGSLNRDKEDAVLTSSVDSYKSDFQSINITVNERLKPASAWLQEVQLVASGAYTSDALRRTQTVHASTASAVSFLEQNGAAEGQFLPSTYISDYRTDSKPLNLNARLSVLSMFGSHRVECGVDVRYEKNLGEGLSYDLARPPYPMLEMQYVRRALDDIPAWVQVAAYVEDAVEMKLGEHRTKLTVGVRASELRNLPRHYALRGKRHLEPRLSLAHQFPALDIDGRRLDIRLRAGYGEQVKYPTLDMLYPNDACFHEIGANYFTVDSTSRFLWVATQRKNRENGVLMVNRNKKKEVGLDIRYAGALLNVTFFEEKSNRAFAFKSYYFPFIHTLYIPSLPMPDGKPTLGDFAPKMDTLLKSYSVPTNGADICKRGVEYRLVLPRINPISTEIEINGAYYRTEYRTSVYEQYMPNLSMDGKSYPYVGVYDWNSNDRVCKRFNSNIWINTHIARYRLIFTTMLQCVWMSSTQYRYHSGVPVAYIAVDGMRPFTEDMMDKQEFIPLVQTYSEYYFNKESLPVSLSLNLKATKELSDHVKMAFLVNRLWDYNRTYRNKVGLIMRDWTKPYFSMELTIKL